jgi:hypothetical protein
MAVSQQPASNALANAQHFKVMSSRALRRVAGVAKGIASGCEAVALIAGTKSQ